MTKTHLGLLATGAVVLAAIVAAPAFCADAAKISVLIIDGQNNHDWKATTPVLKDMLEKSGRFKVDVLTSPPAKAPKDEWDKFRPDFTKYKVVFSNYNGESWPEAVNKAFEAYMAAGGGLVIFHAANNAFTKWDAWTKMVGLLWQGADGGDRITLDNSGKQVRTPKGQGPGAGHGPQWGYEIIVREPNHPIMKGMPPTWTHAKDELYQGQRGPGLNMTVLASAYAPKDKGGNDTHEPMVWTIPFGKGRVFVNLLGHDGTSVAHPGCATLMLRGTEWAATGKVTIPVLPELAASAK
jgi:type 1 glutamine amidotransferase